jgi:hypothetical protein
MSSIAAASHTPTPAIYQASPIKRVRATMAAVEERRLALYNIVANMRPMTVRQVFYQATVENHLPKQQFAILKAAEESEREIIRQLVGNTIEGRRQ